MATIWKETRDGFEAQALRASEDARRISVDLCVDDDLGRFQVVRFRDGGRAKYVLLVVDDVDSRINGTAVAGGIRILDHQDEIVIGGQRLFFSAESVPVVEIYQHDDGRRRPRCPICRAEVQDTQTIVRCPGCSRIYHQIEATGDVPAKPCWTYAPECRFCGHPTSLSGEPGWRPDEEEHQLNVRTQQA